MQMNSEEFKQDGHDLDDLAAFLAQSRRTAMRMANFELREENGKLKKQLVKNTTRKATPENLREFGFIATNTMKFRSIVPVDLDEQFSPGLLDRFSLMPNWVGVNQSNGHAQMFYYLADPVRGDHGNALRYFTFVAKGMSRTFDGDPNFVRMLHRNPFYAGRVMGKSSRPGREFRVAPEYEFHAQHHDPFTLKELHEALGPAVSLDDVLAPAKKRRKGTGRSSRDGIYPNYIDSSNQLQREAYFFDSLRFKAYSRRFSGIELDVKNMADLVLDTEAEIAKRMKDLGDGRGRIDQRRRDGTIARIASWTNAHLTPGVGFQNPGTGTASSSTWAPAQRRAGGATSGRAHVVSGHWQRIEADGRAKGAMSNMLKGLSNKVQVKMMKDADPTLTNREIGEALGLHPMTVSRLLNAD